MFSQAKSEALKVGDLVVVGTTLNGKFVPASSTYGCKVVVERIWQEEPGKVRADLDWQGNGKSRVYLHDELKTWCKLTNFN